MSNSSLNRRSRAIRKRHDRSDNSGLKKFEGIAKIFIEYGVIFSAIIYFTGYIYTAGINLGFYKDDLFAVYNYNSFNIISSKYFIVGMKYLIYEMFLIMVAYSIIKPISSYLKSGKETKLKAFLNSSYIDIPIMCISLVLLYIYLDYDYYSYEFNFVVKFCIYLALIFTYVKSINRRANLKVENLLFIMGYTFIIVCSIFFSGTKYTLKTINGFDKDDKNLYIAMVYTDDNIQDYIKIEDQGDEFIGYNISTGNVDNITKDKIKNIEYTTTSKSIEREKYNIDNSTEENKKVIELLNDYYKYREVNFDAGWQKDNFSDKYYKGLYSNLDKEIINKRYGQADSTFLGVEFTKPDWNEEKNEVTVFTLESYKDEFKYREITIIKNEEKLKIDNIKRCEKRFIFTEYK